MIDLRPSDIYAQQARSIRGVAGLISQAGGLALDLYNAQAVEQENKARVFFAQSEETYNKNLLERTFEVAILPSPEMTPAMAMGLGTTQKRLGELSWSDVLADYEKYYQTQLDYINENVTNKDARTRLTQLLQENAIKHRSQVYNEWSQAAQHEANASLDNLTKTIMAKNIPPDQKIAEVKDAVQKMVQFGRMWKDQGDAYMEKVTNTVQQSWAFTGTLNAMETGGLDAGAEWINANTPFWDANPEMRQKVLDAAYDQKTWMDAKRNEIVKGKSWAAFEDLYAKIQAGKIATYAQIDAIPDLTFEDKMKADAFRRAWLSDERVRAGEAERHSGERAAADATKITGPDYLVYFHDSFNDEDNTPEKLRTLLSWVRDNFLPSTDAPTIPRIGTDKKQQWESMIMTEIRRLESGANKELHGQVQDGRKTISDYYTPQIDDARRGNDLGEYQRLVKERDKKLQEFDLQAEKVKDIPAWANQVLEPARREKVRNALTGKMRPETEAEYFKRIGLPELAPQPYRAKSTEPTHVTQQSTTTPGPQQTATEIADRKVVAQFGQYRKLPNGNLLASNTNQGQRARAGYIWLYDETLKAPVEVPIQTVQQYETARGRLNK